MKHILFIPITLLLMFACKEKKHRTRAQGLVVEAATGKPVANAWVGMKDGMSTSGPINVGTTASDGYTEMYTNDKGEFDLQLEGKYTAYISVGKEKYYPFRYANGGAVTGWQPLNKGLNSGLSMKIESIGYFNPSFKYTGIGNFNDTLNVNLLSFKDKDTPVLASMGKPFLGFGPFKFASMQDGIDMEANRYRPFRVRFKPANCSWVEYLDSAFVPAFGTLSDTIYYPKF